MEAIWVLVLAAIGIAAVAWFRTCAVRAGEPVVRIPADAGKVTAELEANRQWLDAYFALPNQEQERHVDEARRRILDSSELLLAEDVFGDGRSNDPTLWMIRRTKELVAAGMPFSNASVKALEERDTRFPSDFGR
jgi:hypothetical protein